MRIQELEHLVGIERATIRFYEKEGLISPERSENGYRNYSEDDAHELRRIKLLRELGVSLDTIRNLQQGSEDFTAVMERQCRILEGRREQMERARIVCQRISADGVSYIGMDIDRYQNLLNAPLLPQPAGQRFGAVYKEKEIREPHPWRRFFARLLDYELTCAVLWFIMTVVLRWRFNAEFYVWLIGYAVWYVQVPIEAAWIHFLGTTPGKWIFGIRLEAAEGGKLPYIYALFRAWGAFRTGMGWNIPIWNLVCFYMSYRDHTNGWYNEWDDDCEISFRELDWKNWALLAVAYGAVVSLNVASELETQLPRYRTDELTIAQFAANYNYIDHLYSGHTIQVMDRDGVIAEPATTTKMTFSGEGKVTYVPYDPYAQFEYELDGDTIKAINFQHTWYARDWFTERDWFTSDLPIDELDWWAPRYVQTAIVTAIASQEGITLQELNELYRAHISDRSELCADGFTAVYGDVTCTWELDLEKYLDNDESAGQTDVYEVTMDLRIELQ